MLVTKETEAWEAKYYSVVHNGIFGSQVPENMHLSTRDGPV